MTEPVDVVGELLQGKVKGIAASCELAVILWRDALDARRFELADESGTAPDREEGEVVEETRIVEDVADECVCSASLVGVQEPCRLTRAECGRVIADWPTSGRKPLVPEVLKVLSDSRLGFQEPFLSRLWEIKPTPLPTAVGASEKPRKGLGSVNDVVVAAAYQVFLRLGPCQIVV